MQLSLSTEQARVLGCLLEKAVITPDACPLTLNALTLACNQKSGRDPAMALEPGTVQRAAAALADQHLVRIDENFRSGISKYSQAFCNSRYSPNQFSPAEYAIVCLLLLRGPQTPGELRAHSGRLHEFADPAAVVEALGRLLERPGGPLVVQLPRLPGRKDHQYMHLLSGPVDVDALAALAGPASDAGRGGSGSELVVLRARVAALEAEVADLRAQLAARG